MFKRIFQEFLGARFVREVTWLQVGKSLSLVAGFGASVVYARILGPEQYGLYAIVISFAGIVSALINFGVWPTTVTLISEAIGRNDRDEVRSLVIYFVKISLLVTNALWLVLIVFASRLLELVYGDVTLSIYFRLTAFANIASFAILIVVLAYQVSRKISRITYIETSKKFLFVGSGIAFVLAGAGVAGIFYGMLVTEVAFFLVALWLFRSLPRLLPLFPSYSEFVRNFWEVRIGKYLKFGLQIAVDKNLNNFVENLPTFMLGVLSTPEQAGFFKVGYSVGTLPKIFSSNISRLLATIFPFKEAEKTGSLKTYYHKVAKYGTLMSLVFMVAVFAGTKLFFEKLYGAEFLDALPALYIVLLTNLFLGFAVSFAPVVRTLKKMATSIKLNVVALILSALLGLYFIPRYGSIGAALSMGGWFVISLVLIFKIELWLKNET